LPLTALQILWINLIDHGLPSFALTLERQEDDVMRYPPRPRAAPILNREIKIMIFVIVIITDILLLAVFIWMYGVGWEIDYIRTFIFAVSGLDSLLYVFSVRSLRRTIFSKNIFANKYMFWAVAVSLVLILPAFYSPFGPLIFKTIPLGPIDWLIVVLLSFFKLGAIEISKYLLIIKRARSLRRSLA
jgi:Ca2+-transporting ATPase